MLSRQICKFVKKMWILFFYWLYFIISYHFNHFFICWSRDVLWSKHFKCSLVNFLFVASSLCTFAPIMATRKMVRQKWRTTIYHFLYTLSNATIKDLFLNKFSASISYSFSQSCCILWLRLVSCNCTSHAQWK